MKPEHFTSNKTGQVISITGVRDLTHAFIPNRLPPDWTWPEALWPLLLEAHRALSELEGTGKHITNPELVLRPLQNREAQKSSSLEGTFTEPRQQLLFALDPKASTSNVDPINAYREVHNYASALRLWKRVDLPISLRLIRDFHRILMDGVQGSDRTPGEFRRTQNQIGRPARYVPPPVPEHLSLLDNFEKYIHQKSDMDPLVRSFIAHYQFEAIHPFGDGNGRVGRLLLSVQIAEWCNLSNQWLYMSDYFDRKRDEYIDRLFSVSIAGQWTEWIAFCLQGVVEQAKDTLHRYDKLISLHQKFHEVIATSAGSIRLAAIVDELFYLPVAVVARIAERQDVSYPTARSDLIKLDQMGILTEATEVPQLTYYCLPILDIIYAD